MRLFDPSAAETGAGVDDAGAPPAGPRAASGHTATAPGERAPRADPGDDRVQAPLGPAPAEAVRLRLLVAYDGTGFRGFAAQRGQRTVAGELARAISTVARHEVDVRCAGRTDAGVHASGQVVHVDVRPDLAPERLLKAVNAMLGPAVAVRSAARAPDGFDARHSARARTYRYLVLRSDAPHPLLAPVAWELRDRLDLRAMRAGADSLLGEHDFSAFCRRPQGLARDQAIRRRVLDAGWCRLPPFYGELAPGDELLRFEIRAQSFCHQMVRSIVGTLVDIGRGRRTVSDVIAILRSGDRAHATTIAPSHGLCLVNVDYGDGERQDV